MLRVLSANLGWGLAANAAPLDHLRAWIDGLRGLDIQVLFLQEMPADTEWRSILDEQGYHLHEGAPARPRYCRSGVAVHDSVGESRLVTLPAQDYHGSYLAAAEVQLDDLGPVTCVSVHASPTPLAEADIARWTGSEPRRRSGGPADPPVWDSDYVLTSLAVAAGAGPVLAAGDFNEARLWDDHHAGQWGHDYFAFADDAGLRDLTWRAWGEERPTLQPRGDGPAYQVDHAFATEAIASRLDSAEIGPAPGSDHESLLLTFDVTQG
jgi:endonuclease/exonuclease/phosphatase family metal-dependent hydrolase